VQYIFLAIFALLASISFGMVKNNDRINNIFHGVLTDIFAEFDVIISHQATSFWLFLAAVLSGVSLFLFIALYFTGRKQKLILSFWHGKITVDLEGANKETLKNFTKKLIADVPQERPQNIQRAAQMLSFKHT
jgi:hypothetical protein